MVLNKKCNSGRIQKNTYIRCCGKLAMNWRFLMWQIGQWKLKTQEYMHKWMLSPERTKYERPLQCDCIDQLNPTALPGWKFQEGSVCWEYGLNEIEPIEYPRNGRKVESVHSVTNFVGNNPNGARRVEDTSKIAKLVENRFNIEHQLIEWRTQAAHYTINYFAQYNWRNFMCTHTHTISISIVLISGNYGENTNEKNWSFEFWTWLCSRRDFLDYWTMNSSHL